MKSELSSKLSLSNLPSFCDLNLFTLNSAQNNSINPNENLDFNFKFGLLSNYYFPYSFSQVKGLVNV